MTKRLLAVFAGVALVVGLAPSPAAAVAPEVPPPPRGEFDALTYNVAGLPEGLSGSNPSVNTPLISPLLNAYDLVLVQEDWADVPGVPIDFFHDDLISAVDHPYLSTPAPAPNGTDPRRPEALVSDGLNRLSRFPFGEITRVMWPHCFGGANTSDGGAGDCLSQKGFAVARTELAPGVEVDVYNLHAEAGSTPLDVQYSAEDFAVLAAFINEHSAGRAVLVGGDYNLHTDEAVDGAVFDGFLAATGLTDVCTVVDCGSDADEIDKFTFRSGGGVRLEPLSHRFERDRFRRADGEPLSDHDALAVTFRWSGPVAVGIDVEPGQPENRVVLGSGRGVTVAVLSAPGFDARAVLPRTVCFGEPDDVTERACTTHHGELRDVDGDGDRDLLLRFSVEQSGLDAADTRACLTGLTEPGIPVAGCDAIRPK
jgi:hypothetical protein